MIRLGNFIGCLPASVPTSSRVCRASYAIEGTWKRCEHCIDSLRMSEPVT